MSFGGLNGCVAQQELNLLESPPDSRHNFAQVRLMVLVQTDPVADDGRMRPFGPIEALFKGRHFDGQIIVLCVSGMPASS